jgi:hypothetical protein
MTEIILTFPVRRAAALACVWVRTGNPGKPLTCKWVPNSHPGAVSTHTENDESGNCRLCA